MYAIRWKEKSRCFWSGQGYSEAPWQVKKYETREAAACVAARVNGEVVEWEERKTREED